MRSREKTLQDRILGLKVLLEGSPAQARVARGALKKLLQTRNLKDRLLAQSVLDGCPEPSTSVAPPEAPSITIKLEGFTDLEKLDRRMVGLDVKSGRTLLERAEAGEQKAFADLRYWLWHESQPEQDVDYFTGMKVVIPPRRLFTDDERLRAEKIIGDRRMVCRLMLRSVVRHAEKISAGDQLWYEIVRLVDEARGFTNDIEKLLAVEAEILRETDPNKLRLTIISS